MIRFVVAVETDYSQFVVSGLDSPLAGLTDFTSALVAVDADLSSVSVLTGGQQGAVDVATAFCVVASDVGPEWEDVVEFSCTAGPGGIVIGELLEGPALSLVDSGGKYRVRVSARGRDAGAVRALDDISDPDLGLPEPAPVEFYLIEAWPEDPFEPVVVRLTSALSNTDDGDEGDDDQLQPSALATRDAALTASYAIGRDVWRSPYRRFCPFQGTDGSFTPAGLISASA